MHRKMVALKLNTVSTELQGNSQLWCHNGLIIDLRCGGGGLRAKD